MSYVAHSGVSHHKWLVYAMRRLQSPRWPMSPLFTTVPQCSPQNPCNLCTTCTQLISVCNPCVQYHMHIAHMRPQQLQFNLVRRNISPQSDISQRAAGPVQPVQTECNPCCNVSTLQSDITTARIASPTLLSVDLNTIFSGISQIAKCMYPNQCFNPSIRYHR